MKYLPLILLSQSGKGRTKEIDPELADIHRLDVLCPCLPQSESRPTVTTEEGAAQIDPTARIIWQDIEG